jgi:hypothetical protein
MNKHKIHKARLLKLADFLDTIPRQKFNINYITNICGDIELSNKSIKDPECGSVGCAIGYCPVVFPRLFKYYRRITSITHPEVICIKTGKVNFEAVEDVFGLAMGESQQLFSAVSYIGKRSTPHAVAQNIRKFVKRKYVN